jgi:hypothetical protein
MCSILDRSLNEQEKKIKKEKYDLIKKIKTNTARYTRYKGV